MSISKEPISFSIPCPVPPLALRYPAKRGSVAVKVVRRKAPSIIHLLYHTTVCCVPFHSIPSLPSIHTSTHPPSASQSTKPYPPCLSQMKFLTPTFSATRFLFSILTLTLLTYRSYLPCCLFLGWGSCKPLPLATRSHQLS